MGKLKAAIIGLGNIAWKYDSISLRETKDPQTHVGAYQNNGDIILVGGCSPNQEDRTSFTGRYHTPVFESVDELLESTSPDIVSICSPNSMHFKHTIRCLEASIPMIWLEKPPALSIENLNRMIEKENQCKGTVLVNFQRRYCECYQRLRDIFQNQTIGKIMSIRLTYSKGLFLNGSHIIDILFYIIGDDVPLALESVAAEDGDENPSFNLRSPDGLLIFVSGISLQYHCIDIEMTGENGRVSVLYGGMETRVEIMDEHELFPGFYRLKPNNNDMLGYAGLKGAMRNALSDLLWSHQKRRRPRSSLYSARNVLKVMNSVVNKASKRPV